MAQPPQRFAQIHATASCCSWQCAKIGVDREKICEGHGLQIGVMCLVGIQCAKPIKDRTSPQLYKFFTWGVLLYTAVKMWFA